LPAGRLTEKPGVLLTSPGSARAEHGGLLKETAMQPDCLILYVHSPAESVLFYRSLLGREPVEQSPNFAMFMLNDKTMLGLWAAHDVQPASGQRGGGAEIGITARTDAEVDAAAASWRAAGWPVLQPPTRLDFGYTAVTADPDGHRVRVFRPTQG
jgi:catechol 2,3-dioxygenase-like lactoylglutathione lyase family enzyme